MNGTYLLLTTCFVFMLIFTVIMVAPIYVSGMDMDDNPGYVTFLSGGWSVRITLLVIFAVSVYETIFYIYE